MPQQDIGDVVVPGLTAGQSLMVFDGTCVFCNGGARLVHRFDSRGNVRFAHAQSALASDLYRRLGWDERDFQTNILISDGIALTKWASIGGMARAMGGWWRVFSIFDLLPDVIGDPVYAFVARNRYRLFGRSETCIIPDGAMRARMLESGPPAFPARPAAETERRPPIL
jgi:predicted DCC family thiol-disulfide oxidoreductase YuxK